MPKRSRSERGAEDAQPGLALPHRDDGVHHLPPGKPGATVVEARHPKAPGHAPRQNNRLKPFPQHGKDQNNAAHCCNNRHRHFLFSTLPCAFIRSASRVDPWSNLFMDKSLVRGRPGQRSERPCFRGRPFARRPAQISATPAHSRTGPTRVMPAPHTGRNTCTSETRPIETGGLESILTSPAPRRTREGPR